MNGNPNIPDAIVYEIKNFRYAVAMKPMAEIQVLVFQDGEFAARAILINNGEKLKTSKAYGSLEEALDNINLLIEEKIKNYKWVQETIQGIKKYENI